MYNIVNENTNNIPTLEVSHYYKNLKSDYEPKVEFSVCYNEDGFHAHFKVWEKNPRAVQTEHFAPVHTDSCVEWFACFAPELSENYFNFEVNANGVMNVSFRKNRSENVVDLCEEDVLSLGITTEILDEFWTVDYTVPYALMEKYIPGYKFKTGGHILANVYKCGDETDRPHWGCWNMTDPEKLDFHRPEYFKEMYII